MYVNLGGQLLSKLKEETMKKQTKQHKESSERVAKKKAEMSSLKKAEKKDVGRKTLPSSRNCSGQDTGTLAQSLHLPVSVEQTLTTSASSSPSHESEGMKKLKSPPQSTSDVSNLGKGISTQGFYSKSPSVVECGEGNSARTEVSEGKQDSAAEPVARKKKKKKKVATSFEAVLGSLDKKMLQSKKRKLSLVVENKETSRVSSQKSSPLSSVVGNKERSSIAEGEETTSAGGQASTSDQSLPRENHVSKKNLKSAVKQGKVRAPSSLLET